MNVLKAELGNGQLMSVESTFTFLTAVESLTFLVVGSAVVQSWWKDAMTALECGVTVVWAVIVPIPGVKSSQYYSAMVLTLMAGLSEFGQAHRVLGALGIDVTIMNFIGCSIRLLVLAGCSWIIACVGCDPTIHSHTRATDHMRSLSQRRLGCTFKRPPQSLVPRVLRLHLQALLLELRRHSHSR